MPRLSREQRQSLERATLRYSEHIDAAKGWLEERGLDVEHVRSRAYGVVTDPIPGHEHFAGRLAIPYLTDAGPINMNFRCMENHKCKEVPNHAKYMKPKGASGNLYGVQSISWADDWIILTEGELDAETWQQIGVPALGAPGAKAWKDHWTNVLEDFARVYVIAEGDQAGEEFWKLVSSQVTNTIKVPLPNGEDSNSLFVKGGADALVSRIKK